MDVTAAGELLAAKAMVMAVAVLGVILPPRLPQSPSRPLVLVDLGVSAAGDLLAPKAVVMAVAVLGLMRVAVGFDRAPESVRPERIEKREI